MTKIQLMFPQGGSRLSSSGVIPPLGILALATSLKQTNPELNIELYDGEAQTDLVSKLNGDILGLSTTGTNYYHSLELAQAAKAKGMKVIIGGPHATAKHRAILRNQPDIDVAVRSEGEDSLPTIIQALLEERPELLTGLSNVTYRKDGTIISNPGIPKCMQPSLDRHPLPDYSLLGELNDLYAEAFEEHAYREQGYTMFRAIESQKGCAKTEREKDYRCTFCCRVDYGLRRLSPQRFWETVAASTDPAGKAMIWDMSDSFTGRVGLSDLWMQQVLEARPQDLEEIVGFKIFARSDEIDIETIRLLTELNVQEVFIGAESGSQAQLDAANKGSTPAQNMQAVRYLKDAGITTYLSFVYGLPGESAQSLEQTYQHTEDLLRNGMIAGLGYRILWPLAGCIDHQRLIKTMREHGSTKLADEIVDSDWEDSLHLQHLWIEHMTRTSVDEITQYHLRMMDLASKYDVKINDEKRLMFE
ncbi:B12-binding domain-containing radical SAM protein [Nanoarchaeota archaeon]